jgi:hypothetical protein
LSVARAPRGRAIANTQPQPHTTATGSPSQPHLPRPDSRRTMTSWGVPWCPGAGHPERRSLPHSARSAFVRTGSPSPHSPRSSLRSLVPLSSPVSPALCRPWRAVGGGVQVIGGRNGEFGERIGEFGGRRRDRGTRGGRRVRREAGEVVVGAAGVSPLVGSPMGGGLATVISSRSSQFHEFFWATCHGCWSRCVHRRSPY